MAEQIIVADSSPLIALSVAGAVELLPRLYQRVLVPPAVWHEVTVAGAGLPGADTVKKLAWLDIQQPEPLTVEPLSVLIDRGEAEAIALAQSFADAIVLLDDARARRVAQRFDVPRIGTLGILRKAKRSGLIDRIAPLIEQMEAAGIYVAASLVDAILKDVGERL